MALYSASDFFDLGSFEEAKKIIKGMLDAGAKASERLAENIEKLTAVEKEYIKVIKEKQAISESLYQEQLKGKSVTTDMVKEMRKLVDETKSLGKNLNDLRVQKEKLSDSQKK